VSSVTFAAASTPRREQFLNTAALLFRRRGYHAVGIDDIGAALGLSGPAVYRHFTSKQELLAVVINTYLEQLNEERAARLRKDPDQDQVLKCAIAVGSRLPDHLLVYNRDVRYLDETFRPEFVELRERSAASWKTYLERRGVDQHSDEGTLRLVAAAGILIHTSLTKAGSKTRRAALAEELVDAVFGCELGPIGPPNRELTPIRHATTREALLVEAAALFNERDYTTVSLRDIGSSVGLTASAVTRHFATKEHLLSTIFERTAAQVSSSIVAALRFSTSGEEAARDIIRRYADLALEFRDQLGITATHLQLLPPAGRQAHRREGQILLQELTHAIRLGDPEMNLDEARVRAGAATSVVNEVVLHPQLWRYEGIANALPILACSTLFPATAG
jgi:AcrR family transcriptional regulator